MTQNATLTNERKCRLAYELSYFILPNKTYATIIAIQAIEQAPLTARKQIDREEKSPSLQARLEAGYKEYSKLYKKYLKLREKYLKRLEKYLQKGGKEPKIPEKPKEPKKYSSSQTIYLDDLQIIQYQLYECSEEFEKRQEADGETPLTDEDMIVRYLKHLMKVYLSRNCFYATVGQSNFLFHLEDKEIIELYSILIQEIRIEDDMEEAEDDMEEAKDKAAVDAVIEILNRCEQEAKNNGAVRDIRGKIKDKIKERFGRLTSTYIGPRKEEMFVLMEHANDHRDFIKQCLEKLKPLIYVNGQPDNWHVPNKLCNEDLYVHKLLGDLQIKLDSTAEQLAHMRRMHAITHVCCLERLLATQKNQHKMNNLHIPAFNLKNNGGGKHQSSGDRWHPPELSSDEIRGITIQLEKQAKRRKNLFASQVSVVVDGVQRREWNLDQDPTLNIEIEGNAKILKIIARHKTGDVPLAVHLLQLCHPDSDEDDQPDTVILEGGQEFTFTTQYHLNPDGGIDSIEVVVAYRETQLWKAAARSLRRLRSLLPIPLPPPERLLSPAGLKTAAGICAALFIACVAWWLIASPPRGGSSPEFVKDNPAQPSPLPTPIIEGSQTPSLAGHGSAGGDPPTSAKDSGSTRVAKRQSSAPGKKRQEGQQPDQGSQTLAPPPRPEPSKIPDSEIVVKDLSKEGPTRANDIGTRTRSIFGDSLGVRLVDVRIVYVYPFDGDASGPVMRPYLEAEARKSVTLSLADERTKADAIFAGEVTDARDRWKFDVRLVNRAGQILWRVEVLIRKDRAQVALPAAAADVLAKLADEIKKQQGRPTSPPRQ